MLKKHFRTAINKNRSKKWLVGSSDGMICEKAIDHTFSTPPLENTTSAEPAIRSSKLFFFFLLRCLKNLHTRLQTPFLSPGEEGGNSSLTFGTASLAPADTDTPCPPSSSPVPSAARRSSEDCLARFTVFSQSDVLSKYRAPSSGPYFFAMARTSRCRDARIWHKEALQR